MIKLSKQTAQNKSASAGFTLIELLVVLAILGLLVAIAAPPVLRHFGKARTDVSRIQIQNLVSAIDIYKLDVGQYPSQAEGLQALLTRPANAERWNGPYVKSASVFLDPWGNAYLYRVPGEHGDFDLFTLGADKANGGTGENQDVGNW